MTNHAALLAELDAMQSLAGVIRWALDRSPAAEFVDVIVQDEFTHDVVLRVTENVFAVFDTT